MGQAKLVIELVQEDLAAAEAELAGWYETMQRETNALKRIYQSDGLGVPDSPLGAGLGAEGRRPSGEGLQGTKAAGLTRKMSRTGEKADKIAARQLPQVCTGRTLAYIRLSGGLTKLTA